MDEWLKPKFAQGLEEDGIVHHLLSSFPDTLAIYRFGSFGTADEHPESDLDLAVLSTGPLGSVMRWNAAQSIAQIAGRDVDLVDLFLASTVMRLQIVAHGKRLYCADENQVGRFEDNAFSSYARLSEERRGILEDIKHKGSVYGR